MRQVALSCMVNPPQEGDPSYAQWKRERDGEFESLRRRARMVAEGFNSLPGITCNATNGAMYWWGIGGCPRVVCGGCGALHARCMCLHVRRMRLHGAWSLRVALPLARASGPARCP